MRAARCGLWLKTGRDITYRIEAERLLRQSERRFRNIVETAQEGIWTIDADAYTTYVNRRMEQMLGYDPGEMAGRPIYDFMDPSLRPEAERGSKNAARGSVMSTSSACGERMERRF